MLICFSRNENNILTRQKADLCELGLHFVVSDNTMCRGQGGTDVIPFLVMKRLSILGSLQAY